MSAFAILVVTYCAALIGICYVFTRKPVDERDDP